MASAATVCRMGVRVSGTVQGVGFRPFVFRLADELALAGWVRNDERGVEVEVEGDHEAVSVFLARLSSDAPPLARVEGVAAEPLLARGEHGFQIVASTCEHDADAPVAADAATCPECLAELLNPADRRYRYPFINCTNCGPRFTIVRGVPYDRPLTTMAGFAMCPACRAEYENPLDRRFHAQPNACPACGPRVRLLDATMDAPDVVAGVAANAPVAGAAEAAPDAVAAAAELIAAGAIVAVKGLGGYHLACRADSRDAVGALRARKRREERPFALMVADLTAARRLALIAGEEAELLESPARPIVLAPAREDAPVAAAIAPGVRELGVMLPYTPLHHLLLADARAQGVEALVMTSGNVSDEPIAYIDDDARARLATIADAFLVHDRPIHMRTDDSVVRVVRVGEHRRALPLRRSRGYVPASLALPIEARRPLLACGAELKSTFCLARGERAWVGHHIGDLGNWETLRSYREGVAHFEGLFAVTPELVVHDLHPDYLSTAYALERALDDRTPIEPVGVQHHHAHLAACLAEHGETGPAVGVIFDGSGYGTDGTVWGGELLVGDLRSFERAGRLRAVRLPGGDQAVREPWRMACAWLAEAGGDEGSPALPPRLSGLVTPERWDTITRLASSELAPLTTSMGRLFDAVAALCGVRPTVTYEGQAAIELEGAVDPAERGAHPLAVRSVDGVLELDPRPAILAVARECAAGAPLGTVAARFHRGIARAITEAARHIAGAHGLDTVILSGGVFQNRILLEQTANSLGRAGLRVLSPQLLPPNDGGISFGQAAVAAARASADLQRP